MVKFLNLSFVALFLISAVATAQQGQSAQLTLKIADSKVVFYSRALEYFAVVSVDGSEESISLPCRGARVYVPTLESLYKGWTKKDVKANREFFSDEDAISRGKSRDYTLTNCRNAKTQVLAWLSKPEDILVDLVDIVLDEDFDISKNTMRLEVTELETETHKYFSCSKITKEKTGENDKAVFYDVNIKCSKSRSSKPVGLGIAEFVRNPDFYGAYLSYNNAQLPPLAGNQEQLDEVVDKLFEKVPAGSYTGKMKTLSKNCKLNVGVEDGRLKLDHITVGSSGDRTRALDLGPEDLLGFVDGQLYKDPHGLGGEIVGTYAAAQFRLPDGKFPNDILTIRFEDRDDKDDLVVRLLNNGVAYCRRLQAVD